MKQEKRVEIINEVVKKDPIKFVNFLDYLLDNNYKVLIRRDEVTTVVEFGWDNKDWSEIIAWLSDEEYDNYIDYVENNKKESD